MGRQAIVNIQLGMSRLATAFACAFPGDMSLEKKMMTRTPAVEVNSSAVTVVRNSTPNEMIGLDSLSLLRLSKGVA
jgi:hypothetical protein